MHGPGPSLDLLTRHLAECPSELLAAPRQGKAGVVYVDALVCDLLIELGGELTPPGELVEFRSESARQRNRLRLTLVCCWLLHHPVFRHSGHAKAALDFLTTGIRTLAGLVAPDRFVGDPDRREELVRLTLDALGLRPEGESKAHAQDRLTSLSSVERNRVIRAARAAEKRAQELREAMKKKRAQEAAARWGRE